MGQTQVDGMRRFLGMRSQTERLDDLFGGPIVWFFFIISAILALTAYKDNLASLLFFPQSVDAPIREDLAAFYRAGQMARDGQAADIYHWDRFVEPLTGFARTLFFINPPHFLPLTEGLVLGSYASAKAFMLALSALALASIPLALRAGWPMVLFCLFSGAGFYTFSVLNISTIVIGGLVVAVVMAPRFPLLAGVLFGLATVKPQYGLLVPVLLLAERNCRTILMAGVTTLLLVAITWFLYGPAIFDAYLASFSQEPYASRMLNPSPATLTILSLLAKFGLGKTACLTGYLAVLAVCAGLVWCAATRLGRPASLVIFFLASACAAPSFMYYSWALFIAAHCALLQVRKPWVPNIQIWMGLLWAQPVLAMLVDVFAKPFAMGYSVLVEINIIACLVVCSYALFRPALEEEAA